MAEKSYPNRADSAYARRQDGRGEFTTTTVNSGLARRIRKAAGTFDPKKAANWGTPRGA